MKTRKQINRELRQASYKFEHQALQLAPANDQMTTQDWEWLEAELNHQVKYHKDSRDT